MLKLSNYAQSIALLLLTTTRHHRAANAREPVETCGMNGRPISLFAGECNYENFNANVVPSCKEKIGEIPVNSLVALIPDICANVAVEFGEIQGTYQRDRRYFAGSGTYVDGTNFDMDEARTLRFEQNMSRETIIAWPEYASRMEYNSVNNGYPANMNLETECELQAAMCCFTDDSKKGSSFEENGDMVTDVCRHDLLDSPESNHIKEGWGLFRETETETHCVGFTWKTTEEKELIGNMLYDVSLRNTVTKGYVKGVPGAPMCGCIENMPVVEKAACRTAVKTSNEQEYRFYFDAGAVEDPLDELYARVNVPIEYKECDNQDLATHYESKFGPGKIDNHLVEHKGGCQAANEEFLNDEQFLHERDTAKYLEPDPRRWSELVVGKGIYFFPPDHNGTVADDAFRKLVDGGCTSADGSKRYCIVRRICPSCSSKYHRDIYYQRISDLPPFGYDPAAGEVYLLESFMSSFREQFHTLGKDFELYSSYEHAVKGEGAWKDCHHNSHGFPGDCGPMKTFHNQWNSYKNDHGTANHHGFYVELP